VQRLRFLRVASLIVKIVGCIFLLFGLLGGVTILFGASPAINRWAGLLVIFFYSFICFFFYFVAKIGDFVAILLKDS
jgi:hypothetical protein